MHWRISDDAATGLTERGQVELRPKDPLKSPRFVASDAAADVWQALAVKPAQGHSLSAEDLYSREQDLVVRFGQAEGDRYAFQLNWRLLPVDGPFTLGIELWLSIQTDLLDAHPELEVTCRAPHAENVWQALELPAGAEPAAATFREENACPAALLCRGQLSSALWMIEPTDQRQAHLKHSAHSAECQLRLFGHFMEKGVIRRARMRFWIASTAIDDSHWQAAYHQFAHSPLPLTA